MMPHMDIRQTISEFVQTFGFLSGLIIIGMGIGLFSVLQTEPLFYASICTSAFGAYVASVGIASKL